MKFSFLRSIPGLGKPPVRQVAATANEPLAQAAAAALQLLLAELPELLLAAVLDVASGQLLATYAADHGYQPAPLAVPILAEVRQLQAGLAAQGQSADELQEVLLTLSSQLHLLLLRPGGQQLLYLAVDIRDTNLALAHTVAQQAVEQLADLSN